MKKNDQKNKQESCCQGKKAAGAVLKLLKETYPQAHCALVHRNALQLLVATILSAQCTDKRVNMVTPELFRRFPTAAALAAADPAELEQLIRSTGFFRNKAKNIGLAARRIVDQFGGEVPETMTELLTLAGVARKTANVVLYNAFGKNEGVVVDTHVGRTARRLGLSGERVPVKVERDLMALFPRQDWGMLSHYLIELGRDKCRAIKPRCGECALRPLCPYGQRGQSSESDRPETLS